MENDPLLPYVSPRKRAPPPLLPPLFPLPEHDELSLPLPLTPSELKDRLIFGPSSSSSPIGSSPFFDAFTSSLTSPKPSSSSSSPQDNIINLQDPLLQKNLLNSPARASSWLIDPDLTWEKTNLHRSKTAPAMAVLNDVFHPSIPKPQFGSQSIVGQAFILLLLYLSLGVVIFWFNRHNFVGHETHPVVDALYFCIVTMCTIGYGDITPNSVATKLFSILFVLIGFGFIDILLSGMVSYVLDLQENYLLRTVQHDRAFKTLPGRIFAAIWLLVSTLAVARAFLYLAEARVDKRHRRMAKWVLGQDMTVSEFLAADIDNNGFVSKSEFVVYKLKEMGKVSEKDIMQICEKFDRLDAGNCGKITLADLMEGHH
ncbi:hypothetical protein REPUB_Repub14bG0102000 [Reevesia pubescens]